MLTLGLATIRQVRWVLFQGALWVNQFLAQATHALALAEVATEILASSGVPCRAADASGRRLAGDVAATWCAAARAGHDRALVQVWAGRPW